VELEFQRNKHSLPQDIRASIKNEIFAVIGLLRSMRRSSNTPGSLWCPAGAQGAENPSMCRSASIARHIKRLQHNVPPVLRNMTSSGCMHRDGRGVGSAVKGLASSIAGCKGRITSGANAQMGKLEVRLSRRGGGVCPTARTCRKAARQQQQAQAAAPPTERTSATAEPAEPAPAPSEPEPPPKLGKAWSGKL
jgi:hypothetical protein